VDSIYVLFRQHSQEIVNLFGRHLGVVADNEAKAPAPDFTNHLERAVEIDTNLA
jgi:hypothetical protein